MRLGVLTTFASGGPSVEKFVEAATSHRLPVVVDSGAWSNFTGGAAVTLQEHLEWVLEHQHRWPTARFIALDVIGDGEQSFRNWKREREAGARVEPTFHFGTTREDVARYVDAGLGEGEWVNFGGLVPSMKKEAQQRRMAAWAAYLRTALPEGSKVHGLGATNPGLNSLVRFESIDSTYWRLPLLRFRNLPLFDSKKGRWVLFLTSTTHREGYREGWTKAHRYGEFLRKEYGIEPSAISSGDDEALLAISVASQVKFVDYFRERHRSGLVTYLAAASLQHFPLIASKGSTS